MNKQSSKKSAFFRRALGAALALALTCSAAGAAMGKGIAGGNCPYRLSDFSGGEALVMYTDGGLETVLCSVEELASLAAREDVELIQPNFSYGQAGAAVNDSYYGEQWALHNDGTGSVADVIEVPSEWSGAQPGGGSWDIGLWEGILDDDFWEDDFWDYVEELPDGWKKVKVIQLPSDGFDAADQLFRWLDSRFFGQADSSPVFPYSQAVSGIDINMDKARELYPGGRRETVVSMIDTGVDMNHEDFNSNVFWVNKGEIPGNGIDDDKNGFIDDVNGWNFYGNNNVLCSGIEDSHGTHNAGSMVAAANNSQGIAGIIGDGAVKLMPVKALGGSAGAGTTADVIRAIQYAETNGAVICNLSMGTTYYDPALYRVMAQSKMLFVVSAGNEGANLDNRPCYPAAFDLDNILCVSNLQANGKLNCSSNYGARSADIAAPGTSILSLTPGNSYSYMSGTSMAAPIVSAAAAMVYASAGQQLAASQVKDILMKTAAPLESLKDYVQTGGMLDLGAAMAALQ